MTSPEDRGLLTMSGNVVLIEHERGRVRSAALPAITAAQQLGGGVTLLLVGEGLREIAGSLQGYGAERILLADDAALRDPVADRYAEVIAQVVRGAGASCLLGAASTFTKDILPRVAALLDWPMLSDVSGMEMVGGVWQYRRPIAAGTAVATVELDSPSRVLTIRPSAFAAPRSAAGATAIEPVAIDTSRLPDGTRWLSQEERADDRPDLTEARVVVGGGRPLRTPEAFDQLIGGLARALGAAIGATRAAVDAGLAPNDWQIGQTGKMIAPDLYIAVGISGAVQHAAGVRDARVIVAINKDAEAPIFEIATYGLVGDLHQVVPELIAALRGHGPGSGPFFGR